MKSWTTKLAKGREKREQLSCTSRSFATFAIRVLCSSEGKGHDERS